jgi:hypothetical protein
VERYRRAHDDESTPDDEKADDNISTLKEGISENPDIEKEIRTKDSDEEEEPTLDDDEIVVDSFSKNDQNASSSSSNSSSSSIDALVPQERSEFEKCNLIFRFPDRDELSYGHYQDDNNEIPLSLDQTKIKLLPMTRATVGRIKLLPVTTSSTSFKLGKDWTRSIYDLNRNKFFYLDRNTNMLYQTRTMVSRRSAGIATTRSTCKHLGVEVSSVKDFNNSGTSLRYSSWPKQYIPGLLGYCCPLAAYYICKQLTKEQVVMLQELYHAPKAMKNGSTIFATDGTYVLP